MFLTYIDNDETICSSWDFRMMTNCETGCIERVMRCNNCEIIYSFDFKKYKFNYCPNCGAKMRRDYEKDYN